MAMHLKSQLVIVYSFSLIACSSPGDIRQGKPNTEFSSAKPAKTVAVCIADKWENSGFFGVGTIPSNLRPTDTGYTVFFTNGAGGIAFLADVDNTNTGSKTAFYKGGVLGGSERFLGSVRSCQ